MPIRILQTPAELDMYDAWVREHAQGSLWQSLEWGKYQQALGKEVRIYTNEERKMKSEKYDMTALVVIDRTVGGYATWDIPRGPLASEKLTVNSEKYTEEFVQEIVDEAKKDKCLALYVSPPSLFTLHSSFFISSPRHIQPQASRIIDLTQSEDDILAQMHPKGRYNISLARKHGIIVESFGSNGPPEQSIDSFYALLQGTGDRDGFRIFQKSHYKRFLADLKGSFLLMAMYQGKPIAGLIGIIWPPPLTTPPKREGNQGQVGIYYYGASSYEHRNLMAPYLLQWEAIRRAKANGCTHYDLLGISPENARSDDPWRGISDFKRKFGGTVVTYPPEQMIVMRPVMKLALEMKRKVLG